jgi:hypothetical protein
MKPQGKVKIKWSRNFAYAIGLIVADGSLSKSGRHISFVSKDIRQIRNFLKALDIKVLIGDVTGFNNSKAFRVQFGDVIFYRFLESIGIMNNKSKILGELVIPSEYFPDFLRGLFDGDGYSNSYWDKRWASSYMFYICFTSASEKFVDWLRQNLKEKIGVAGHVVYPGEGKSCLQLRYAKNEAIMIKEYMYYSGVELFLPRKLLKIRKSLDIVGKSKE